MLGDVVAWMLAGVLAGAALLKVRDRRASQAALATYGIAGASARRMAWGAVVALELGLAAGLALGSSVAAYAAAAMFAGFAFALVVALARGRRGAPCGCLGARSRVGWPAIVRVGALAVACSAVPTLGGVEPSTEGWLGAGLIVALIGVAGLGVAVLALARELGDLRLRLGPQGALEIAGEGPELGSRSDLLAEFGGAAEARMALAVFTSESCPVCHSLEPAVEYLARDPLVVLRRFDEHRDAAAWQALDVPGSPYAVALGLDGTVLAKGTFNSLGQLESVMATAERREREVAGA